jgi:dTDP-glucose 4,6-dehydratase
MDRPGQVSCHLASTEKAFQVLGWKASAKVDEGLMHTIQWYIQHPEWWQRRLSMRSVTVTDARGRTFKY